MRKTKLWLALIAVVMLTLTCVWCRIRQKEQQAISEEHVSLTVRSEASGELASVQLRVRARLSPSQLQQELRFRQVNLQKIFNQTSNTSLAAPETAREVRRKILIELHPVRVISLSWKVNTLAGRHPSPKVLELLKKSPGTLGYVNPEAEH
jgi:hypothetical protein